jgi:hypothetical protein
MGINMTQFTRVFGNRLTGARCQCAGCDGLFNSVTAFDQHRVGEPLHRRCLTVDEMTWQGMSVNKAGFWITEPHLKRRSQGRARELKATISQTPCLPKGGG